MRGARPLLCAELLRGKPYLGQSIRIDGEANGHLATVRFDRAARLASTDPDDPADRIAGWLRPSGKADKLSDLPSVRWRTVDCGGLR